MKEILKKHKKVKKILLYAFCFTLLTCKIIYDYSPLLSMKSAFVNTLNKHKSDFSEFFKGTNRIIADLSYKTADGKSKVINALFDDSVLGFSLDGHDSVYYTIPIDNIKNIITSDYFNKLIMSDKALYKTSKPFFLISSLFSVKLNENIDLKLLNKAFSNVKIIRGKGTFLSNEKSFSFVMPSESIAEIVEYVFCFDTVSKQMQNLHLTDIVYVKDGNYIFDIEISENTFKSIKCSTPSKNGSSYCLQINFDYPKISLRVETLISQNKKCIFSMQSSIYEKENHKAVEISIKNGSHNETGNTLIFTLSADTKRKNDSYVEKSIYSLTLGELIKLSKTVSDSWNSDFRHVLMHSNKG